MSDLTKGSWMAMRQRCLDPHHRKYKNYGGKGVAICARWDSYRAFRDDMGERPSAAHSIDRFPDKTGNYEPGNCRWAVQIEQQRNRTNNRVLKFGGRSQCLAAWAEEIGINAGTLKNRIRAGWGIATALTTPVRERLTTFVDSYHKRKALAAREFRKRNPGRGARAT